jgi:hypothetical protein
MPEWNGCELGHTRKAMECPSCSGSDDQKWFKWYRSRTSSKAVKERIDAYLSHSSVSDTQPAGATDAIGPLAPAIGHEDETAGGRAPMERP